MRYYWKGIQHFFGANSRHGTHSPFVYRLTEEVIYTPKAKRNATLAMPAGFSPFYTPLLSDLLHFMEIDSLKSLKDYQPHSAILVDFNHDNIDALLAALENGAVLVVDEPFKEGQRKLLWEQLVKNTSVSVAMDFFHFGILIHREGQRKEYFRLRYPYWR